MDDAVKCVLIWVCGGTIVLTSIIWAVATTGAPYEELRTKAFIECVKATQKASECKLAANTK